MHYSAGVDGSADIRPISEEHGVDGRRYFTAVKSGYIMPMKESFSDNFDGTISQPDEDERQPLLNSDETVQRDYAAFPRPSFDSEGTQKRRAIFENSVTTGPETSELTAIPVPFYVTLWLWCLHSLSAAFAKIFSREKGL